jgi:predicted nucleic-acid-binding Zn-ribbon protein
MIPFEINIKLKQCPICDTWMEGNSGQTEHGLFRVKIVNENKIVCPNCGYTEKQIQEYPQLARDLYDALKLQEEICSSNDSGKRVEEQASVCVEERS